MSIRLQDIAEHVGLSVSTVSLALRDASQVAEETRVRVRDAAMQLGYIQRPRQASSTKLTKVAYVTPIETSNVFYSGVLSGVESECRRHGIALHYALLEELTPRVLAQFAEDDGLLAVGTIPEPAVAQLKALGCPMVLVDNNLPHLGLDRVLIENVGSIYRVVHWLAGLGHRQIAFLRGPDGIPSFAERLWGYRMAMSALGLEPLELLNQEMSEAAVYHSIGASLDSERRPSYTALVAHYDVAAVHALHALQDYGVGVPEEVSVVGFDDVELVRVVRPALATCHVHRALLGVLGVQRLIERASQPDAPPVALTVDTVLVEGSSVQRPAQRVRVIEQGALTKQSHEIYNSQTT